MPFYENIAFYMYVAAGAPYAAFVGFYWVRTPTWRQTPIGRGLMAQALSLTAMFAYICLLLAVPVSEELKDMLRALLLGGITIAGALMLKNLLVEQSKQREADSQK